MLVMRWREKVDGVVFCAVLYCNPTDPGASKNKDFVHSTFRLLHEAGMFEGITSITHFSDTGTAHFRNANSLYLFSLFQQETGIKVRICVYPSYHGHNLCDSNAGVAKQIVRYHAQTLEVSGGLWDVAFVRGCLQSQRGATLLDVLLDNRPNFVQPIKDISQFHDFSIPKNGEIACRYFFDSSHVLVQKFVKL